MKGGVLFAGGGGYCLGMVQAGISHAWGIEYDDNIASIARLNGLNTITMDILECNPSKLEPVDLLHASPPCPNFSTAKKDAKETVNDLALADKICEFIIELLPTLFTLENVYQYRKSKSWQRIAKTLLNHGYQFNYWHVNMADYGVPQTRKRMIVIARRDGIKPMLPEATHDENPVNGFFETKQRWVSWYDAIEDLIPDLPDSEFTQWQLKKLPHNCNTFIMNAANPNGNEKRKYRTKNEPCKTITAGDSLSIRASINGHVVKMIPQSLARIQSIKENYIIPVNDVLACRIIGNAVPPLFAKHLVNSLLK